MRYLTHFILHVQSEPEPSSWDSLCLLCSTHRSPSHSHRIKNANLCLFSAQKRRVQIEAVRTYVIRIEADCRRRCLWSIYIMCWCLAYLKISMETENWHQFLHWWRPSMYVLVLPRIICRIACSACRGNENGAYFIHDIVGKPLYSLFRNWNIYISESNLIL